MIFGRAVGSLRDHSAEEVSNGMEERVPVTVKQGEGTKRLPVIIILNTKSSCVEEGSWNVHESMPEHRVS